MNPRMLFALAVALAFAAAGLYWVGQATDAQDEVDVQTNDNVVEDNNVTVLQGSLEDVAEVIIHRAERMDLLRLAPDGDGLWNLTESIDDRASSAMLGQVSQLLFQFPAQPLEVAWSERTDAELGFAEARVELEVRDHQGAVQRLRIGAQHPNGETAFALSNGTRIQVPIYLLDLLQRPIEQWREAMVARFPRSVTKLEWKPADGSAGFTIENTGTRWDLVEPIQGPLDPIRVKTLLRLVNMRASSLPVDMAEPEVLKKLAQSGGQLLLHSRLDEQRSDTQEIRIHLPNVVYSADRRFTLPVYPDDLKLLELQAEELRSRAILRFDPSHIASIRVTRPEGVTELRKTSLGWADMDGELLPSAARKKLVAHLVQLASLETQVLAERPTEVPARQLMLSISARPIERGSSLLWFWPSPDQGTILGTAQSRQHYATELDLDSIWQEILSE